MKPVSRNASIGKYDKEVSALSSNKSFYHKQQKCNTYIHHFQLAVYRDSLIHDAEQLFLDFPNRVLKFEQLLNSNEVMKRH